MNKLTDEDCYENVILLREELEQIPGIGPIRATHIIQLSALLGLIPIQLYTHILPNFKMKGGPMSFFREQMKWNEMNIDTQYKEELKELQQLYSNNLTSNIFENTACIIGRKQQKYDVMYHFPVFENGLSFSKAISNIQLVFRVKMVDVRNISLVCKPSTSCKEFVVFDSSTSAGKSNDIISFHRTPNDFDTNTTLLSNQNHHFDKNEFEQWFDSTPDTESIASQSLHLRDIALPSFEDHYSKRQRIDNFENWNQFSVIHSTPGNRFNFFIYNGSHKLKNDEYIKPSTKVLIKFPAKGSYFIVFHGRLVHGGGESCNLSDGSVEKSTRLFSYLTVPVHNALSRSSRHSRRLKNYTKNIHENKVDTSSFKMNWNYIQNADSVKVVELPEYDDNNSSNEIIPFAGNMIDHGWEVYRGINFSSYQFKSFNKQMSLLIKDQGSKFGKINQTERRSFDIDTLEARLNKSIASSMTLYRAYRILLNSFLRKIPYLDEVTQDKFLVLCNMGYVCEQIPHRDYSSVKK